MSRSLFIRSLIFAVAAFGFAIGAHAQGRCSNVQVNQAFTAMTMVPNGSGSSGECNANRYGAGSWTGLPDLEVRIVHARACSDPWIGQIYWYTYNRNPTAAECNVSLYGGGQWSGYMDLANKVKAYHSAPAAVAGPALASNQYLVDPRGNLVDFRGGVVAAANTYLIGDSGSTLVGPSGGTMLPQPGMVISNDGGSLTGQRSLQSVGGKRVIAAKVVRR
ncbi:MAG: hypothetical protein V4555_08590 [Acidobacteriota bacterium]